MGTQKKLLEVNRVKSDIVPKRKCGRSRKITARNVPDDSRVEKLKCEDGENVNPAQETDSAKIKHPGLLAETCEKPVSGINTLFTEDSCKYSSYSSKDCRMSSSHLISQLRRGGYGEYDYVPDDTVNSLINRIRNKDEELYASYPAKDGTCVGVCYSGGYDSILLIAAAVERGETVVPIRLGVNWYMSGMWILAEYALLKLRRKYPRRICKAVTPIEMMEFSGREEFCGYRLQPSVAFSLAFIGEYTREKLKEIQVGFICKDECISFLAEFEGLYHAANKFVMPYDGGDVPLTYPLKKFVKAEIIRRLDNLGLIDSIPMITCENPESYIVGNKDGVVVVVEPCASCMSCHTMEVANRSRVDAPVIAVFGTENSPSCYEIERMLHEIVEDPRDNILCEDSCDCPKERVDVVRSGEDSRSDAAPAVISQERKNCAESFSKRCEEAIRARRHKAPKRESHK